MGEGRGGRNALRRCINASSATITTVSHLPCNFNDPLKVTSPIRSLPTTTTTVTPAAAAADYATVEISTANPAEFAGSGLHVQRLRADTCLRRMRAARPPITEGDIKDWSWWRIVMRRQVVDGLSKSRAAATRKEINYARFEVAVWPSVDAFLIYIWPG